MIRRIRIVWQVFFLVLFFVLLWRATQLRMDAWPVGLFAWVDPLLGLSATLAASRADAWVRLLFVAALALAAALAVRRGPRWRWAGAVVAIAAGGAYLTAADIAFHRPLAWGLVVVGATIVLGRVWCGWICPLGTIQDAVGRLGQRTRTRRRRAEVNRYRRAYALKYYLLVGLLVAAVFGVQQAGLLDPIALLTRSSTAVLLPADDAAATALLGDAAQGWTWFPQEHLTVGAWVIGAVFAAVLLAGLWVPRLFCRAVCPLGAMLGVLGRYSLFRFRRSESACTRCRLCDGVCPGAAEPAGELRTAECMACFNCSELCPEEAVRFGPAAGAGAHERPEADLSRRGLITAALAGFFAWPFARRVSGARARPSPGAVRPPGALAEDDFLAACVKCHACLRACPTNVIQPAVAQAGWEGFWTPVMDFRLGYCEYNCTACGSACPTGAIRAIGLDAKHGTGDFAGAGPVRLGTAFVDRGRCLPWAMDRPCIVCQEVCPVSPKAIELRRGEGNGGQADLQRPVVVPERCIGCGICSHKCPVADAPAIYVTAIGATRDRSHRLAL